MTPYEQTDAMLSERLKEMYLYVSEGATDEDLDAAGYTQEEIATIPKPEYEPFTSKEGDTITQYNPTVRENIRGGVAATAESLGASKGYAYQLGESAAGSDSQMGLLDFTPVGTAMSAQEGKRQFQRGYNTGSKTDMAMGALDVGLGVVEAIPGTKLLTEGIIRGVKSNTRKVGEKVQEPVTEELIEYNNKVRKPANLLDRDKVNPSDNILYRPDRVYRFIGKKGYEDFLEQGVIRAKQGTKAGYEIPYFAKGKSSSRYGQGESGEYLVEVIPDETTWRGAAQSFAEDKYVGSKTSIPKDGPIRVYRRKEDGTFEVVLDNIGDTALLPEKGYAEGGVVKEEQMNRLMQEGGMADDGMSKEPVTGNSIPPGALASEVRDDVDAKLSGGEYVVPADVLRYYGVRFFEDLRSQAKQGMMDMESEGRIGGVPVGPRGVPLEGQDDELSPEEEQMLAQAMSSSGMAEGGLAFDRKNFNLTYGDGGQYGGNIESRVYFDPATGKKQTINFMNGTALGTIPAGFVPWSQALQDNYDANKASEDNSSGGSNSKDDEDDKDPTSSNYNYTKWGEKNYDAITKDPFSFGMDALKDDAGKAGINMPGLAGGLLSLVTGGGNRIQNVAEANASLKLMESQGLAGTENYKTLANAVKSYISDLPMAEQSMLATKIAGTGLGYIKVLEEMGAGVKPTATPTATTPTATPTATTPTATPTGVSGGAGSSQSRGGSDNDKAGSRPSYAPTNKDKAPVVTTDSKLSFGSTASQKRDKPANDPSDYKPSKSTTAPKPNITTTVSTPSGPQKVSVKPGTSYKAPTPKPSTPKAGSQRFAEGGLAAKPKKTPAKTKGLAGKE